MASNAIVVVSHFELGTLDTESFLSFFFFFPFVRVLLMFGTDNSQSSEFEANPGASQVAVLVRVVRLEFR